jgi:hypothetical protein
MFCFLIPKSGLTFLQSLMLYLNLTSFILKILSTRVLNTCKSSSQTTALSGICGEPKLIWMGSTLSRRFGGRLFGGRLVDTRSTSPT